jgi:hypothetical protein
MIKKFEEFKDSEKEIKNECMMLDNSIREIIYQRIKSVVMDSLLDYDEKIDAELNQFIDRIYKAPVQITDKQELFNRYDRELEIVVYNKDTGKIYQYVFDDLLNNIGTSKEDADVLAKEYIDSISTGIDVVGQIGEIRDELADKFLGDDDSGVLDIDVLADDIGDFINIVVKNNTEVSVPESYKGFRLKIKRSDEQDKIEEYKKLNESLLKDFLKEVNEEL